MRVYFTLGRSPVEANSVVVVSFIIGVSLAAGCVHSSVILENRLMKEFTTIKWKKATLNDF